MRIAVIGGGVLGLTLAYRLAKGHHRVEVFEASAGIGGLAAPHDYGSFVWDRFYHCILPQDRFLLGLLRDLGLEADLRWTKTGTGYYAQGRSHSMSGNADFLRFPLLGPLDKVRLGAAVVCATRLADPWKLYGITAQDWLVRLCGLRAYQVFWRPLLRAKFGVFYDRVAAVFIWATLTRLLGARSATAKEHLGYVSGGYRRILERFRQALADAGATIRTGSPVRSLRLEKTTAAVAGAPGCELTYERGGELRSSRFDQVFFTGPTRLARAVACGALLAHVEEVERVYPGSEAYLGVTCVVLALKRALTPYYVLNIGEESALTGVIEMTNLIDRHVETKGLHLVYLPKYLDSNDALFDQSDPDVNTALMDQSLKRIFPTLRREDIVYRGVHRAKYVQPLPLVRSVPSLRSRSLPALCTPFQVLNTSMLACATLNNDEVVGLVDRFFEAQRDKLAATPS